MTARTIVAGFLAVSLLGAAPLAAAPPAADVAAQYARKLAQAKENFDLAATDWAGLAGAPSGEAVGVAAQAMLDVALMEFVYPTEHAEAVAARRAKMGADFAGWPVEARLQVLQTMQEKLLDPVFRKWLTGHYVAARDKAGVPEKFFGDVATLPLALKTATAHYCYRLKYADGVLPVKMDGRYEIKDGAIHDLGRELTALEKAHPALEKGVAACRTVRHREKALEDWEREADEQYQAALKAQKATAVSANGTWKMQMALNSLRTYAGLVAQVDPSHPKVAKYIGERERLQAELEVWRAKRAAEWKVPAHLSKMSGFRKAFTAALQRRFPAGADHGWPATYLSMPVVGISVPADWTYSGVGNVDRSVDAWVVVKPTAEQDEPTAAKGWCVAIETRFGQHTTLGSKDWSEPEFETTWTVVQFDCRNFEK